MSATAQTTLLCRDHFWFLQLGKVKRDGKRQEIRRPSERRELSEDDLDASRREILGKIGQFAYVAPASALLAEPKAVDAYGMRPGNGYGDKNHVHTGPPGQNKKHE